jgi:Uma2 family endonuclease
MGIPERNSNEKYTYADYLSWPVDEHYELIYGIIYDMAAAPNRIHQDIAAQLTHELVAYFRGKNCKVYPAPFEVRLPEKGQQEHEITTVVQPDISIICDGKKLDTRGCKGTPDLIMEIISPHTALKDKREKFHLYEKHGVKEYWIIYPYEYMVEIYKPDEKGKYRFPEVYDSHDVVNVKLFPGLKIDLSLIFPGIED